MTPNSQSPAEQLKRSQLLALIEKRLQHYQPVNASLSAALLGRNWMFAAAAKIRDARREREKHIAPRDPFLATMRKKQGSSYESAGTRTGEKLVQHMDHGVDRLGAGRRGRLLTARNAALSKYRERPAPVLGLAWAGQARHGSRNLASTTRAI